MEIKAKMNREEKRKRFHEALANMLYPPPPSPPHQEENRDEKYRENLNMQSITDEFGKEKSTSLSSDNEEEGKSTGPASKLTRAQRKRIRKKKLKEAASRRRTMIGPLLPAAIACDEVDRQNDTEKPADTAAESSEQPASRLKQNKLRCRRMAKKLASGRSKSTASAENVGQDQAITCNKNENQHKP